jgi:hypothetical protein
MLAQLVVLHLVIDIADESVAVEIRERDWCNTVLLVHSILGNSASMVALGCASSDYDKSVLYH